MTRNICIEQGARGIAIELPTMTPVQAGQLAEVLDAIENALWARYGDDIFLLDRSEGESPDNNIEDDLPF